MQLHRMSGHSCKARPLPIYSSNLIRHPNPTHPTGKILHIPSHQLPSSHLSRRQNNRIRHLQPLLPANHSRTVRHRRRNRQTLEVQEKSPQNRLLILPLSSLRPPKTCQAPKQRIPAPILNNRVAWEFHPTRYNRHRDKKSPGHKPGLSPLTLNRRKEGPITAAPKVRT